MAQMSENVGCRMLDEFVDDAGQACENPKSRANRAKDECLQELVYRIASEMAVPQFNLGEVIEKVVSAVSPQIEERVRQELQEIKLRQEQSYNDSFTG